MHLPKVIAGLVALALVAAVVVGVVVLTAGDDEPDVDFAAIAAATRAAGPARYTGEISSGLGGGGPIDGRYDLEAQAWVATYPFLVGERIDVEIRRLGDVVYVKRPGARRSWVETDLESRIAQHIVPLDPVEVVASLGDDDSEVDVEAAEDAEVDGEAVTHYEVLVRRSSQQDTLSAASQRQFGINSTPFPALRGDSVVDLWVDADDVLRRIRITSATIVSEVELSEFGTEATVEPPPAEDTVPQREAETTVPVEPVGEFAPVLSGSSAGVDWTLERAPGDRDTECFRLDTANPFPLVGDADVTDPDAERDGVVCVEPLDEGLQFEEYFQGVLVGDGGAGPDGLDVFVARVPDGVTEVRLGVSGGTSQPWPVQDGWVVWFGPLEPALGWLGLTDAEGSDYDCAPGPIYDLTELRDLDADATLAARGWDWTCLPRI